MIIGLILSQFENRVPPRPLLGGGGGGGGEGGCVGSVAPLQYCR